MFDADDSAAQFKDLMPGAKPDAVQATRALVSQAKNAGLSPEQARDAARAPREREAAAVGVASAAWGEAPVAFVVARPGVEAASLKDCLNGRVGKTQRIADLRLVDELPRKDQGKVDKKKLEADEDDEEPA